MHPGRVDVIGAGALILDRIMARFGFARFWSASTHNSTASPGRWWPSAGAPVLPARLRLAGELRYRGDPRRRSAAQVIGSRTRARLAELTARQSVCPHVRGLSPGGRTSPPCGASHSAMNPTGAGPSRAGDNAPGILIVGLRRGPRRQQDRPGIHRRTGAADFPVASLHRCGLANAAQSSVSAGDGQRLTAPIVARFRCAPPENKVVSPEERDTWRSLAVRRIGNDPRSSPALVVCLAVRVAGAVASAALAAGYRQPRPRPAFRSRRLKLESAPRQRRRG